MAIAAPVSGKYWRSSNEVLRRPGSVEEGQIVTANGGAYRGDPAATHSLFFERVLDR